MTDLGKNSGFTTTVAVEDAEEGVLQVLLVLGLLVGHAEHVLHVLPAALVAVARHPQVQPD